VPRDKRLCYFLHEMEDSIEDYFILKEKESQEDKVLDFKNLKH
jgi:hypothetical protein